MQHRHLICAPSWRCTAVLYYCSVVVLSYYSAVVPLCLKLMTAALDVGAAGRRCCGLRHSHARVAPTCAVTPPCTLISGRILGPPGGSEIRVGGSVARSRRLSSAAQGKERDSGVAQQRRAAWLCASPWLCEWAALACQRVLPVRVSKRCPRAAAYTSARPIPPSTYVRVSG